MDGKSKTRTYGDFGMNDREVMQNDRYVFFLLMAEALADEGL